MRISTTTFQHDAVSQMQELEAQIAKTQQQLSTSKRVQSASDDPAGMAQVDQMNVQMSASVQYVTNGDAASTNLKLEEQALSDATNTMQNARDLAVEANNSALSASQRKDIAVQLQQDLADLVAIGNRTDSAGKYLFGGYADSSAPFAQSGNTVSYSGANAVSQVQISPNQSISKGDTGAAAFMNIVAGNGTFTTAAAAGNTGSASIDPGSMTNPSAWVADTYTVSFSSPTQYQVTNSGGSVVTSGPYATGDTIAFNGAQITLSGTPAAGDKFTVAPAGTASAFSTLSNLIATLSDPTLNAAQIATQIGAAVNQIDSTVNSFSDVAASAGARINAITNSQATAQSTQTSLTASISAIVSTNYDQATTQLSTQLLSLQAAQQSYASISQLSLFKYLS
jgi:flagellar hook-associated protein 3 FlgL